MNVHLIAIVGGSGSGKTWLSEQLMGRLGGFAGRVCLDDFYRCLAHLPEAERLRVQFDDPAAIDWPLFQKAMISLRQGGSVSLPSYDFVAHFRHRNLRPWHPRPLVLVDGLWLLLNEELRALFSLSVYLDCPEEVRLARRLERDQQERGRSAEAIREQFRQQVIPMHNRFVAPQSRHADLVVPGERSGAQVAELGAILGRLIQPGAISK